MEPEPPFFLLGAGADPIWSEPESAPGPRTSGAGAAQKSGGSATLGVSVHYNERVVQCTVYSVTRVSTLLKTMRYGLK